MLKINPILFSTKLFISLVILSLIGIFFLQNYIWKNTENALYQILGEKAQIQAKAFSVIPALVDYIEKKNEFEINKLMQDLFKQSDASFIVIGDSRGYRLFHSANRSIHEPMVGGDNKEVLEGNSVITVSKGSLGKSLRGKAPIFNKKREIVGIVSVGYMLDELNSLQRKQFIPFTILCFVMFTVLFIFSLLFSKTIKKQMLNLEPKDIALLVKMQSSIMESILEGIIAIDLKYKVININRSAKNILSLKIDSNNLAHQSISEIVQSTDMLFKYFNKEKDIYDHICYVNNIVVIANCIRIAVDNKIQGWVITFRRFHDINLLSKQLTQITEYVDNFRTLKHEYLNWVSTLSGLLYMEKYEEAKTFISLYSHENQKSLDFITEKINVPAICGLIIGKYAKSNEIGLNFILDPDCKLSSLPSLITEAEFMSIVGNLIDNAFNACLKNPKGGKTVFLYINDSNDEVVLEVSDHGCGIDENIRDTIFEPGITSQKSKEHGIGLHLVSTYTKKANGYVTFDDNQPYGTIFSVFIPKYSI